MTLLNTSGSLGTSCTTSIFALKLNLKNSTYAQLNVHILVTGICAYIHIYTNLSVGARIRVI